MSVTEAAFEPPAVKALKSAVELAMSKLDSGQAQSITVENGAWDEKRKVYSQTSAEGVTTEYALKRSPFVGDKYAVYDKSYRVESGPDGKQKKTEVVFDSGKNEWVKKNAIQKAGDALSRPKWMSGGVDQVMGADGAKFSLKIEKAKPKLFKP